MRVHEPAWQACASAAHAHAHLGQRGLRARGRGRTWAPPATARASDALRPSGAARGAAASISCRRAPPPQ